MTRLAVLWKNKAISFRTKIKLNKSLVTATLLMRELDDNCGSGETHPRLRKQILQGDVCDIIHTHKQFLAVPNGYKELLRKLVSVSVN